MSEPPKSPKIYHITHVDNLAAIAESGGLLSDAAILAAGGGHAIIGMSDIKQRRLHLPVRCHGGTCVGDYVPFYFCSRSIMLYVIHRANHPSLEFRGGQEPIVHLQADLYDTVTWADENERRWAFSLSNAGANYAEFRCDVEQLDEIEWTAVRATQWAAQEIKEAKQAEFLLYGGFPWSLVSRIGVRNAEVKAQAEAALEEAAHKPPVEVRQNWYY